MTTLTTTAASAVALPETELLQVLQSSLYPGAALPSIRMVLGYCKAAGLDPMQKPVHIVPMWDSKAGQMRDVVMPGVGMYRTQAARTGCAGVSEPEFGPDVTAHVGGQEITYPLWCRVTVKRRQHGGQVDEFTTREFWLENYAVRGGKDKSIAPNAMWTKRPYGQLAKCAEAQALRKAFPEVGSQPTAEEMEGKDIQAHDAASALPPATAVVDAQAWIAKVLCTKTDEDAAAVWAQASKAIAVAKDRAAYTAVKSTVVEHRRALAADADAAKQQEHSGDFVADMEAAEQVGQ